MDTAPEQSDEVLGSLRALTDAVSLLVQDNREFKEMLRLLVQQRTVKEWYSTAEVAELLGKAEFTVREWCRQHRINAQKRRSGRGAFPSWTIAREEVLRIEREGLLPLLNRRRES